MISCLLSAPSSTVFCSLTLVAVQPQQRPSRSEASGGGIPLREHLGPWWAYEGTGSCSQCPHSPTVVNSSTAGQWQTGRVDPPQILLLKGRISSDPPSERKTSAGGRIGLLRQASWLSERGLCHWAAGASSFPHGDSAGIPGRVAGRGMIFRLFVPRTPRKGWGLCWGEGQGWLWEGTDWLRGLETYIFSLVSYQEPAWCRHALYAQVCFVLRSTSQFQLAEISQGY